MRIKTRACISRNFVTTVRSAFVFHIVHTQNSYSTHHCNIAIVIGGAGRFWYKLNDTTDGAFYFFLDEQWPSASGDDNCTSKLAKARFRGRLTIF